MINLRGLKLLIISHTEHYKTEEGTVVGWGPTITEINLLTDLFEEITHIGMLHEGTPPPSALPYSSEAIKFVPLPPLGGKSLGAKLKLLWNAPQVLRRIRKELKTADYFQLRTPTGIGVYVIPYLTWFSKTPGWYKYAGNWNQKHPPLGYALQRWFLKNQNRPVTINGKWKYQPAHCLSFENPCLTEAEVQLGEQITKTKSVTDKINLCYVGRLETPKGVGRILVALKGLDPSVKKRLGTLHLVGDGPERSRFEQLAKETDVEVQFHGFLPRLQVFEIYKQCQAFVMPTNASEGFPKVLAEAMNFGCIPIVSNISSIKQYIEDNKQGWLLEDPGPENLALQITKLTQLPNNMYLDLLKEQRQVVSKFTFGYYKQKIKNKILNQIT